MVYEYYYSCVLGLYPSSRFLFTTQRPEIGTVFINRAQLSRVLPEGGDRIYCPKPCALNKNTTMDNVQKHNNCII
jgi:hypothetical protein